MGIKPSRPHMRWRLYPFSYRLNSLDNWRQFLLCSGYRATVKQFPMVNIFVTWFRWVCDGAETNTQRSAHQSVYRNDFHPSGFTEVRFKTTFLNHSGTVEVTLSDHFKICLKNVHVWSNLVVNEFAWKISRKMWWEGWPTSKRSSNTQPQSTRWRQLQCSFQCFYEGNFHNFSLTADPVQILIDIDRLRHSDTDSEWLDGTVCNCS